MLIPLPFAPRRPLVPDGRRALAVALVALSFVTGGCSTYSSFSLQLRTDLTNKELQKAIEKVEKKGGDDPDVLNLLERGLLYHYDERYEDSNQAFQLADRKIDDQFTRSISGEALAFLTNDGNLPYSGYPHEQVLMHIYGALNYTFLGNVQDALVECRKVGLRLDQLKNLRENKRGYRDDAFAEWLSGMLFAEDGDGNAAMVSARRARAAYEEYERLFSVPTPAQFLLDHYRWALRFGFSSEAEELLRQNPWIEEAYRPLGEDEGEVVLLYESGFVDHLEERALSFPILSSDSGHNDLELALITTQRGPRGVWVGGSNVHVEYWLRVAMPEMVRTPSTLSRARLRSDGRSAQAQVAEDISAIARLTFGEDQGKRLLKTILRALAKWRLTKAAGEQNEVAGILANITAAATERADTRSWTTLPDRISIARLRLPAGRHRVVVECLDEKGRVGQTATFDEVLVVPGESTILRHRSYR